MYLRHCHDPDTHAFEFITIKLGSGPTYPKYDDKQKPIKGHPVFFAQYAAATCCRECLRVWHGIEKGRMLTEDEVGLAVR